MLDVADKNENGGNGRLSFGSSFIQNKISNCKLAGESILDVAGFAFSHDDCLILRSFLFDFADSGNVVELNLSDCSLGDNNIGIILSAIKFHPALSKLVLKGNGITSNSCEAIGTFLHENATLKQLILCWNELGINGYQFSRLAAGLLVNNGLQELDLRSNGLDSEAITKLSEALSENRGILKLDLRWNAGIGAIGGQALVKAVSRHGANLNLTSLRIDGCGVPSDMVDIIQGWLLLHRERQRAFEREEKAFRAISKHVETSTSISEEKTRLLHEALKKKEAEIKLLENKWGEQLEILADELTEARGNVVVATSRLATIESELSLEKHRVTDLQAQLDGAIQTARQATGRAIAAETKLASSTNDIERRWLAEKSQFEVKIGDSDKEVDRLRFCLDESRTQRTELEERVAKLAAEKAAAEVELANAKSGVDAALVRERVAFQERLDMLERRWRDAVSSSDNDRLAAERQHASALRDATDELTRLQRTIRDLSQSLTTSQHDLSNAREEADSAKQRADKATKEAAHYASEFESLRSRAENAVAVEKKAAERIRELEREVEKLSVESSSNKKKLERLYASLHAAQNYARQLHHPLQECLALADDVAEP